MSLTRVLQLTNRDLEKERVSDSKQNSPYTENRTQVYRINHSQQHRHKDGQSLTQFALVGNTGLWLQKITKICEDVRGRNVTNRLTVD